MIGLYLFFKMMAVLIIACGWILIGTVYALFWIGYAAVVTTWYLTLGLIWVVTFIVMAVKEVRQSRRERQLIEA